MEESYVSNKTKYLSANVLTNLGDLIFEYATRTWLSTISNSTTLLAIFSSLEIVTNILMNFFGGILADRNNRKNILIVTDIICGTSCLLTIIFFNFGKYEFAILCITNMILAICYSFYSPALKSIVADLFDKNNIPKVNSLQNIFSESLKIIGPIIGVIIYNYVGFTGALLINAMSFYLAAINEYRFININSSNNRLKKQQKLNIIGEFLEGFKYIKTEKKF